jgi:hypothetical protein
MIEILSAGLGFLAPFCGEAVKFFQRRQDNEHELKMLTLQMQKGQQEHLWRAEEIRIEGDIKAEIAETAEIHKPMQSFGVQLLDAAQDKLAGWALYPAFYLFVALDFLSGLVRPAITYAAFGFYMAVKWAELEIARQSSSLSAALLNVWGAEDRAIVLLVLGFWFGNRQHLKAFGKK